MIFKDITDSSGIDYTGASYGVAWGDYNQDGFIDFWVGNHGFSATLYQNQGDGTFTDVTAQAFGHQPRGDFHGAAWADFDNDGDLDLIQLVGGDAGKSSLSDPELANRLYVNNEGVFQDRAIELNLGYVGSRGRNPLWFDYNQDGRLDLFQGAALRRDGAVPATIFQQPQLEGEFINLSPTLDFDLDGTRFGLLSDLVGDNIPELLLVNPREGISVYDVQQGIFADSPPELNNITNEVFEGEYSAVDLVSADFNGDLLPDLYITQRGLSNSGFTAIEPNSLNLNLIVEEQHQGITWQTEGTITIDLWTFGFAFEEIEPENIFIGAARLNPEELDSSLGAANEIITELTLTLDPNDQRIHGLADFTSGEDEGLYIGYDPDDAIWELQLSTPEEDLVAAIIHSDHEIINTQAIAFNNNLDPNPDQLLLNNGQRLVDHTDGSGINSVRTAGVSTVAGDFDNDMDLDLYVVTTNSAGNEPNVLYDNQGDGTFRAIEDLGDGVGTTLGVGDTVSTVDYNNDGFLDVLITNGEFPHLLNRTAPYQLLENQGNDYHWLTVDLEGVVSNRDAIGTKVYVTSGGVTQLRQQTGGIHEQAQNDPRLHFGLGENTLVENIRIEWSSGIVQNIENVSVDQIIDIVEPNSLLVEF